MPQISKQIAPLLKACINLKGCSQCSKWMEAGMSKFTKAQETTRIPSIAEQLVERLKVTTIIPRQMTFKHNTKLWTDTCDLVDYSNKYTQHNSTRCPAAHNSLSPLLDLYVGKTGFDGLVWWISTNYLQDESGEKFILCPYQCLLSLALPMLNVWVPKCRQHCRLTIWRYIWLVERKNANLMLTKMVRGALQEIYVCCPCLWRCLKWAHQVLFTPDSSNNGHIHEHEHDGHGCGENSNQKCSA